MMQETIVHQAIPEPPGTLLPTYHLVVRDRNEYLYSSSEQQLREQFRFLVPRRNPDALTPPGVSFDDGHASQYKYAFPLLQEYGIRAAFFVITDWIGRRSAFMSWEQLGELVAAGHEVHSHGLTHRFLTQCSDSDLRQELHLSKNLLEQRLGICVDAISIPFGRWDRRVLAACVHAGYERIYTSDPRPVTKLHGQQVLGRFMVRRSTEVHELQRILNADRKTLLLMQAKHECKHLLRRAVGETNYHRLWGALRSRKSLFAAGREY